MRGWAGILRRELTVSFRSPLAGALGGAFVLLAGAVAWLDLQEYMRASVQLAARLRMMGLPPQFLDLNDTLLAQNLGGLAFLCLIFLPLLGMGLLADERRGGTLELLMTSPLGEWPLVLGKWCGALLLYAFLLALTLPAQLLLAPHGDLALPVVATAYLGLLLMGAAFLALTLALGAFTRSPVIAAAGGFALMFLLWALDGFARPGATGFPHGLLTSLSALGHLAPFLRGLVDTADLIYFAVLSVLGLDLARRGLASLRAGG